MKYKLFKLFIVLSTCAWVSALAQEAGLKERRKLANTVIQANQQLVDPVKMAVEMADAAKLEMVGRIKRAHPDQSDAYYAKATDIIARETRAYMDDVMTGPASAMSEAMSNLYAVRFTASELRELIKIYQNPLIKRSAVMLAEEMPNLMDPHIQSILLRAQTLAPRINQALVGEGLMPLPSP